MNYVPRMCILVWYNNSTCLIILLYTNVLTLILIFKGQYYKQIKESYSKILVQEYLWFLFCDLSWLVKSVVSILMIPYLCLYQENKKCLLFTVCISSTKILFKRITHLLFQQRFVGHFGDRSVPACIKQRHVKKN